jgi:DNA-binding response OmpR family regulator
MDDVSPGALPRVLLVDDDAMLARAVPRALRNHAVVTVAGDTAAALEALREGAPPDVVLLDLHLGAESGLALLALLRERHPETADRVILLTGGATSLEEVRGIEQSGRPCLEKPLSMDELARRVAMQAARSGAHPG